MLWWSTVPRLLNTSGSIDDRPIRPVPLSNHYFLGLPSGKWPGGVYCDPYGGRGVGEEERRILLHEVQPQRKDIWYVWPVS